MAVFDERSHFWIYDSCEFQLATNAVNYDVRTNQSTTAFNKVDVSLDTSIRTDQNIYFSINASTNATITPTASGSGTSPGTVYYDSDDSHPYVYQA